MNAQELFHQDGRTAGVYYCGECRNVAKTRERADTCCAPYKCTYCGCDVDRKTYRTACPDCIAKKDVALEAEKFEKAEKLKDYDGPVFTDRTGYNEGFFPSLEELYDHFGDADWDDEASTKLPAYAWACNVFQFVHGNVSDLKDGMEGYEDWDGETQGDDELQAALDAWAEKNKGLVRWEPDYSRCVLLNESNTDLCHGKNS